jgi:hypothetical protein
MAAKRTHAGVPHIPRTDWRRHENFPHQALLLGSHDNFRAVSAHLVNRSMASWSNSPIAPPRAELLDLFVRWKRAMRSHEHYEEGKLYPYLRARYGIDASGLEAQHDELGRCDQAVHAAYRSKDALRFAHALKKHDEILIPHLEQEEEAVIPPLLSLSREEFDRYTRSDIGALLQSLDGDRV